MPKENTNRIKFLEDRLLAYKSAYYQGKALVADEVYDALEDELRSLSPKSKVLEMVGSKDLAGDVQHTPPMLSLNKTYKPQDIDDFAKEHQIVRTIKCDGSAHRLVFKVSEDKEEAFFTFSASRGNGEKGQDCSDKICEGKNFIKRFKVPESLKDLSGLDLIELRGEIVFPVSAFSSYEDEFESIRNAVAGVLNRKDARLSASKAKSDAIDRLEFILYDVLLKDSKGNLLDGFSSYTESLKEFGGLGFNLPEVVLLSKGDKESEAIESIYEKKRDYLFDGVVYRIDDNKVFQEKGATGHHPLGAIAFKVQGETKETLIQDIELNVGRTGKVSFTALLEPVELSGAVLSRATLHNAEFVEQGFGKGARIEIVRSGEVIPYVTALREKGQDYKVPTKCPSCGEDLERVGPELFCRNDICEAKVLNYLLFFMQTIEIKGVAEAAIKALVDGGLVKEPADLFKLTANDFMGLEGFKKKSSDNAVKAIEAARKIPLFRFIASLGIKGAGKRKGKDLARVYGNLETIRKVSVKDLKKIEGWAEKTSKAFVEGLSKKKDMIDRLCEVVEIEGPVKATSGGEVSSMAGKSVVITGKLSMPRPKLAEILEGAGLKVSSSVTSKTDYLLCDGPSSSSKYKKAESLGVATISEEEMLKAIGEKV